MFFVSSHGEMYQSCIPQKIHFHPATGEQIGVDNPIGAQFRAALAPEWAREIAKRTFKFSGLADESLADLRISWFDTDEEAMIRGWTAEQKAEVERVLVKMQHPELFLRVEAPVSNAPWPNYESTRGGGRGKTNAGAIIETAREIGVPLAEVLEYERKTRNRGDIVLALEEALLEDPEPVEETVAA